MKSYRESHLGRGADYDRTFAARPYRALMWRLEQTVLRRILGECEGTGPDRHLDFACGTGRILAFVEQFVHEAWGVDVSETMISEARARVKKATIVQGDLTREQIFMARSFDLITAFRFFPNAEPPLRQEVMAELSKCLKPGGRLVFGNHRHSGSIRNRIKKLAGRAVEGMTAREGVNLVESNGLVIESIVALGLWPGREVSVIAATGLAESVERMLAGTRLLRPIANNLIYVCRKTS